MKIKQYRAEDMRTALRQVRDAQGPDAVILSSRRVPGGVEVVAAVDYDGEDAATEQLAQSTPGSRDVSYGAAPAPSNLVDTYGADRPSVPKPRPQQPSVAAPSHAAAKDRDLDLSRFELADANSDMNEELRTLRRMLETQLATLAWNDLSRRSPIQTELLKQMTQLGLAQQLATEIVTQMPTRLELAEANRLALALLARKIETTGERWMDSGGVVALVGATGVGKTTLIAKLAARWVMRHGPRDIALVSTDSVRIGAQEQIQTLGRLLGVPAYAIDGAAELADVLDHLDDKRLVLIDTAGLSPRDPRVEEELMLLAAASTRMETTLVLSAAAQAGAIEEAVQRFAPARPATCVLTKLDEATSLGGVISTLIRARLPVSYVSEGQRVPEDLAPARAHQLIVRAVELSRKSGASADEDLLRRRFGTVAHAIA
ncbi:MAG: flagellar biosynthesis protein FlhF [Pseudomonadota bacterium]|nr:flagellar biosynthesis protein FlhF [Pseudomonadota bacterium]